MTQVTPRPKKKAKRGGPKRDKEVATKLHSLLVRARGKCEHCGYRCPCPEAPAKHQPKPLCQLECAHIITRARAATRTDLENAFCLCCSCHSRFTLEPVEFGVYVLETLGEEKYEGLYLKAQCGLSETPLMFWRGERARLQKLYDEMVRSGT